jgi:hypothetical protein
LFDGASWQDDPALLTPQMECFRALRHLHEACALLTIAATLPLPEPVEARRLQLLGRLTPGDMTPEIAAQLAAGPALTEVRGFLRSLAAHAPKRASR